MKALNILFISLFFIGIRGTISAQESGDHPSFRFENVPLRMSIDSLMRQFPVSIVYLDNDVEGKFITASCVNCSFEQALDNILYGTGLMWIQIGNQVVLREQETQDTRSEGTISGTAADSITGEHIAGASIILQDDSDRENKSVHSWCSTNAFGFFSLPHIKAGSYVMAVRALGYVPAERTIEVKDSTSIRRDIDMMQKDIVLNGITIEGRRIAMTSTEGISHGLYLRSVPTDPNQYLIDGGRIYNPSHFGGVQSTFNSEALNDVQIVKGGLPPDYGGRIGGVVDYSLRDGNREQLSGSMSAGTLGSSLSLEGPLDETTTFLMSGRVGYINSSIQLFHAGDSLSRMGSSEYVAKLTRRLSGSQQVSLSGYWGTDSYAGEAAGAGERIDNNFSWNNGMLDLRWIGIVSPSLFIYSSLVYSRYSFDLGHNLVQSSIPYSGTPLSSDYTIEDICYRAHVEDFYDRDHTVRAGIELVHHAMDANISRFSSQVAAYTLRNYTSWETSIYLQDQWKILSRITAEIGARATGFSGSQGSFSSVDPRFSLVANINDRTLLYGSLSTITQFIHPYNNSGVFLLYPALFWYPSTEKIRPTTSSQGTIGIERDFLDDAYNLSAETYYRIINNFHEFALDTAAGASKQLDDEIIFGSAKTYGILCILQKRTGNLTGTISYNLSWSFESFAQINGGKEFLPPFDRRHEIQMAGEYRMDQNWSFGALCVFALGQSSSITPLVVRSPGHIDSGSPIPMDNIQNNVELIDVNGNRLPGFQRLELNVVRHFSFNRFPCQLSFRFMNSYGLQDPFIWNLQGGNSTPLRWNATLRYAALFPLYPSLELTMRF
jgi:hypothetical protein